MMGEKCPDGLVLSLSIDEVINLYVFFNLYLNDFLDLTSCLSDLHKDVFKSCEDTVCMFDSVLFNRISDVE